MFTNDYLFIPINAKDKAVPFASFDTKIQCLFIMHFVIGVSVLQNKTVLFFALLLTSILLFFYKCERHMYVFSCDICLT